MIEDVQLLKLGESPKTYRRIFQVDPQYKYAIVRHIPRSVGGLTFAPDTVPLQDRPVGDGKGDVRPISQAWWRHIWTINNPGGYAYARAIGAMWINQGYDMESPDPQPPAKAESITCGGNFIAYDDETVTHVRLVSYRYNVAPTDPFAENWQEMPYLYFKAIAINKDGALINPANNEDAFFPLIAKTELWIHKKYIELFPEGDYNYRLHGTDVYDFDQPLMTVTKDRVRIFHRAGWKLDTVGVIQPM